MKQFFLGVALIVLNFWIPVLTIAIPPDVATEERATPRQPMRRNMTTGEREEAPQHVLPEYAKAQFGHWLIECEDLRFCSLNYCQLIGEEQAFFQLQIDQHGEEEIWLITIHDEGVDVMQPLIIHLPGQFRLPVSYQTIGSKNGYFLEHSDWSELENYFDGNDFFEVAYNRTEAGTKHLSLELSGLTPARTFLENHMNQQETESERTASEEDVEQFTKELGEIRNNAYTTASRTMWLLQAIALASFFIWQ